MLIIWKKGTDYPPPNSQSRSCDERKFRKDENSISKKWTKYVTKTISISRIKIKCVIIYSGDAAEVNKRKKETKGGPPTKITSFLKKK